MSHYGNQKHRGNKALLGVLIVLVGLLLFVRQIGLLPDLNLHLTWPVILIAVGLFIGIRNRFSSPAPFILLAIGIFNLIPAFTFTLGGREIDSEDLVVPLLIMLAGIVIIFKPRKKKHWNELQTTELISDKSVEADVVFGGRKEIVTSKDFKGGRVTATFGGAEINLLQADSTAQTIVLEVRATFGGCEIIVPSNWDIKNEVETVLGSVEDKRTLRSPEASENRKTLVLRGSCFCGGIEIKSF
jgi:predicted membrane protein